MPLTLDRPKCLVEVAGRPILAFQLEWLAAQGVDQVVISCGYQAERIRQYLTAPPMDVIYAVEREPLGRGGGLRYALSKLAGQEPLVALNGDLITDLPLAPMLRRHRTSGALATLLLVPYVSQHGVVDVDDAGRIVAFREKPSLPYLLSGGVYIISPDIQRLLPKKGDHETSTYPRLAAQGRLQGHPYQGLWQSIDSPKDVGEAERLLAKRRK